MDSRTWRCNCGGAHYVHLEEWDEGVLCVEAYALAESWRRRLRLAWHAIRNGRQLWVDIVLTEKTAAEIADAIRPPRN